MPFVWISKTSGQRARGGGCIGCLPFGCLTIVPMVALMTALLLAF